MGVVLRMARKRREANGFESFAQIEKKEAESTRRAINVARPMETLIIPGHEVVQVSALNVSLDSRSGFVTDTDISAMSLGGSGMVRELVAWAPDGGESLEGGLEDDLQSSTSSGSSMRHSAGSGTWDQFETNRQRFGVESTFNENL